MAVVLIERNLAAFLDAKGFGRFDKSSPSIFLQSAPDSPDAAIIVRPRGGGPADQYPQGDIFQRSVIEILVRGATSAWEATKLIAIAIVKLFREATDADLNLTNNVGYSVTVLNHEPAALQEDQRQRVYFSNQYAFTFYRKD
jgi:hypothetical protein